MSFSLTVTKIDFQTMPSVTRDFSGHEINNLRPSTEGNTSSAAIFEDANGRTIYVTQTYSAVQTSKTNDMVEAGAELQSNKATDFATLNDTLYPTTDAVEDNFQGRHAYTGAGTDTYTATLVPATTPFAGMVIRVKFANANTGAATFNAAPIKKGTGGATALSAADIVTTKWYTLIYDGTNWQIDL